MRGLEVRRLAAVSSALLLAAVGCRNVTLPPPVGTFEVGPGGAKAELPLPGGAIEIEVPPGAVEQPITLTATIASSAAPGHVGPVYELGPSGTQFLKPVAIRVARPKDLSPGLRGRVLFMVTEDKGSWSQIPTTLKPNGRLEGLTTHFSNFSLLALCRDAGTSTSFALNGCPTFNPRITSSVPVTLQAEANVGIMILSFAGGSPDADIAISGLIPGHTYSKYQDTLLNRADIAASPAGVLSYHQELSSPHVVFLMEEHASIELRSDTCVAPMGSWNPTTHTCTLLQDVTESMQIVEAGLTLDCADPTTRARHRIGSAARRLGFGISVRTPSPAPTIRNCDIFNASYGIGTMVPSAPGLKVESVSIKVPLSEMPGGTAVVANSVGNETLTDVEIENYGYGIETVGADGFVARRVSIRPVWDAIYFEAERGLTFEDLSVDGSLAKTVNGQPDIPFAPLSVFYTPAVAFRRLTMSNLQAFAEGLSVGPGSSATIEWARVTGAHTAVKLESGLGSVLSGSTLTGNEVGLDIAGDHRVFHNNIHGNSVSQVVATNPIELSDTLATSPSYHQGNYWGRSCPTLFIPGVDSDRADAIDSHPYGIADGWSMGELAGCSPPAPTITSPRDGDFLNTARPHVVGTATPGGTVAVTANKSAFGSGLANLQGSFDIQPLASLADGQYALAATTSLGGRTSAPSAAVNITIDTQPPAPPAIIFPENGSQLSIGDLGVAGTAEAGSTVTLQNSGVVLGSAVADQTGNFSIPVSLPNGSYALSAVATDAASNGSAPSQTIRLTIQAPSSTAPALGSKGYLQITSIHNIPNPFNPAASQVGTLEVAGTVSGVQGVNGSGKVTFDVCLSQAIKTIAGTALLSLQSCVPLNRSGLTPSFTVKTTWAGMDTAGTRLPTGTYPFDFTLTVERKIPGAPANPPDCSSGTALNGPCRLDLFRGVGALGIQWPLRKDLKICLAPCLPGDLARRCTDKYACSASTACVDYCHECQTVGKTCGFGPCTVTTCASQCLPNTSKATGEDCYGKGFNGIDDDCNGVVDDCCPTIGFTPIPFELSSRGEYPHDPDPNLTQRNYTNNLNAVRHLIMSHWPTSWSMGFRALDTQPLASDGAGNTVGDFLMIEDQILSGVLTGCSQEKPCLTKVFDQTRLPATFFFHTDDSVTRSGWRTSDIEIQCSAPTDAIFWDLKTDVHYDGLLIWPDDRAWVSVDVPADALVRAHLSHPPQVTNRENNSFPSRAEFTAAYPDLSGRSTSFDPRVRRFRMDSCTESYWPFGFTLPPRSECAFLPDAPSTTTWIGEVLDLPVLPELTRWTFRISSIQGAGPFALFFSVQRGEFHRGIRYAAKNIRVPAPYVELAHAEIGSMLQAMMQLSDGQYSISDHGEFTNAAVYATSKDVVLGPDDDMSYFGIQTDTACLQGATGITMGVCTPFSYIFIPLSYWSRANLNGCRRPTLQEVGETLAHEWGHYEFCMDDDYNPDPPYQSLCGHSIMNSRWSIRDLNSTEWCTPFNHGRDRDLGAPSPTNFPNWVNALITHPEFRHPDTGTPLPTQFGPFGAAQRAGWFQHN